MSDKARDLALLALVFAIVVLIRVTAASDLATGDQPLQVAYIHDIVTNGNWIVQHLPDGTPAAKPPLYNWLAAIAVTALGDFEGALKLPSMLAGLLAVLLTWSIARSEYGDNAGFIAGLLFIASPMFSKHVWFARTDMLLTALVIAQMWAAQQTRPAVFWTAAALALLTKGPVGVLIPVIACSAWWWHEHTFGERWNAMRWKIGLPLSLGAFGVWFGAAIATGGRAVFDQLVIAETLDRFRAHSSKSKENRHILYYIPHFFARMAPVSILAAAEIWKVGVRPSLSAPPMQIARDSVESEGLTPTFRATHGLAFWWLTTGFVFLSLIPSKRADRLFPLLPAACILAAHVVSRWRKPRLVAAVLTVLMLLGIFAYQNGVIPSNRLEVKETPSAPSPSSRR